MKLLTLGAVLLAFSLTFTASAGGCTPGKSEPTLAVGAYYVVNDVCQPSCAFAVWIYEETNGIQGLQRHDAGKDDTCGGFIEPDSMVI